MLTDLVLQGGPKTFIAQSYFDTDGHLGGESWWLLQPAVKAQGTNKNLFLELKDLESNSFSPHQG